ncbi:MAG: undecaprenyldiphospho-muramoylpentapeptide beta-N-acetylglucosaminyltransferase [Candidatus Obscuribacterales bacterium]|nr:undecaprenyldiphospho-muramoylpentapeptide beta-N-acetylglucosaminyltransferase [Candidatus Obscuribacterales bacterium]
MDRHRIVLTGGGTGGHVYPALSVAEKLVADQSVEAILYIGARGHIEESLAAERQLDFVGLSVSGLPRSLSPRLFSWPFETLAAISKAKKILNEFRPTCVLGTGGYASAAPLAAALLSKIPIAVHEPDAHPGLVNRLFSKHASLVSLGMEGAISRLAKGRAKIVVNGNPVRQTFVDLLQKGQASAVLGLRSELTTIVITGGSQGARAINESLTGALPRLLENEEPLQIIHQAGEKNLHELKESLPESILKHPRYCLRPYFEDMAVVYGASDLAVCRAGAMTIAELAVTGTPSIFIPYPYAAQDHQMHNARYLEKKGAALVIAQDELDSSRLANLILSTIAEKEKLANMKAAMKSLGRPQAANDLANQLKELSSAFLNR